MSGTPKNDRFQAIENQLCSHRLFSMYRDYQREVFTWLRDVKNGVHTFADYCAQGKHRIDDCELDDRKAQRLLHERGIAEPWPGYFASLSAASDRLPSGYPKSIMLDSGAFTAWNKGAMVTLDEVRSAYTDFLGQADGLFDEIWLVNLDVIPGEKGREPSQAELAQATEQSDRNLVSLRAEFGDCVLPVLHQGEGKARLLEVVDQATGYLCVSPTNSTPQKHVHEEDRWRWATLVRSALSDLDCNVRTHGLATTGNNMVRNASLFSGDSEAWLRHARYGVVDLVEDETNIAECPTSVSTRDANGNNIEVDRFLKVEETTKRRYKGYHISAEHNDLDRLSGDKIIDNAKHFERLNPEKREWVRSRVERHLPFMLAHFDLRARSLINLTELSSFGEANTWREPTGPTLAVRDENEELMDREPYYGKKVEVHPYPLAEDRQRFLSCSAVYESL